MSSPEECICSIALTQIPGIGHIWAKKLLDGVGNAVDVFRYRKELPDRLPGVNSRVVEALDCPQALSRATQEFEFAEKNHISCLAFTDERYPSRLRECDDAPVVLFFKGAADLNSLRVINMVGTRNATDYTRVRDNILKSKEQKNIQPTKGGHKMVTCQNYVSLFYRQITSCPSDGGIS